MRVRHRRVNALAKAFAVVGIVVALHGIATDHARTFRAGILTLIVSAFTAQHLTSRNNQERLMQQQAELARTTMQERQLYSEMGYKAARLDAQTERIPQTSDAEVVVLPHARSHSPRMRSNGSA